MIGCRSEIDWQTDNLPLKGTLKVSLPKQASRSVRWFCVFMLLVCGWCKPSLVDEVHLPIAFVINSEE